MAQLTARVSLNGDGTSCASAFEPKVLVFPATLNTYHYSFVNKLKVGSLCSSICTLSSSSSSSSSSSCSSTSIKKSPNFGAKTLGSSNGEVGDDDEYYDYAYDSESEWDELASFRCLVLDVSYRPVNVVCWRRALCLEFTEKVDVLEYYNQTVNSAAGLFYIPAVLRVRNLLQVFKRRRIKANLNRSNILFRDNYSCQYCSSGENLTIDHVVPIAEGGEWKWENVVTACSKCNFRKGQKTLEEANLKLIRIPKAPKDFDILVIPLTSAAIRMLKLRKGMPEEWRQYLADPVHSP